MKQKHSKPISTDEIKSHVYPETKLSDKQLEAINKVIGPAPKQGSKPAKAARKKSVTPSVDFDNISIENDIKKQEPIRIPEIEKDRTVVKTVFLVIFLVLFVAAAGIAGWYYWWTTHATFEHTLHPVVILDGQSVTPEDFMYPGEEMAKVTAVFQDPDFDPFVGLQYVPLTLTLGLRTVDAAAALYVLTSIDSIEHEFAEEGTTLRAVDMLNNPEIAANVPFNVIFTETPKPLEEYDVGEHTLHLSLNGVPFSVLLIVADTTPPSAIPVPVSSNIGEEVTPEQFITEEFDASGIKSIAFEQEPDVFLQSDEEQDVKIIIEDMNGNSETFTSSLTLILNLTPPVIEGVTAVIESKINTKIDFLADVVAHDDFGRAMTPQVKDENVDISTVGTYTAVIFVEDYSGNIAEEDVTVHIISANPEEVFEQIDTILASITNDRMSQVEKARAIHNWVRSRLQKSSTASDSESLIEVALPALSERSGDRRGNSQVYSAISTLMLTRAGIENMLINRIESADTPHRWVIINPDEKGWHHFDPFPTGMVLGNLTAMFTEKEANDIARRAKHNFSIDDYYTFDKDSYPEIVKE